MRHNDDDAMTQSCPGSTQVANARGPPRGTMSMGPRPRAQGLGQVPRETNTPQNGYYSGWWVVVGGWWLVVVGWWLVVVGWWLLVGG